MYLKIVKNTVFFDNQEVAERLADSLNVRDSILGSRPNIFGRDVPAIEFLSLYAFCKFFELDTSCYFKFEEDDGLYSTGLSLGSDGFYRGFCPDSDIFFNGVKLGYSDREHKSITAIGQKLLGRNDFLTSKTVEEIIQKFPLGSEK